MVYSSFTDETPPLPPVTRCHLDLDRECPRTSFLRQEREAASCGPAICLITDSNSRLGRADSHRGGRGVEEQRTRAVWRRRPHAYPQDEDDSGQLTGPRAKGDQCGEGPGPQSIESVSAPRWTDTRKSWGTAEASPLQGQVPGAGALVRHPGAWATGTCMTSPRER